MFLLSANRRSDRRDIRLQGRRRVGALNPRRRSRFTRSLRVPAGTAARSYFLLACADGLRRVRERSERNNCRAASRRLAVTRPLATVPTPPATLTPPTPPGPAADTTAPATPALDGHRSGVPEPHEHDAHADGIGRARIDRAHLRGSEL